MTNANPPLPKPSAQGPRPLSTPILTPAGYNERQRLRLIEG